MPLLRINAISDNVCPSWELMLFLKIYAFSGDFMAFPSFEVVPVSPFPKCTSQWLKDGLTEKVCCLSSCQGWGKYFWHGQYHFALLFLDCKRWRKAKTSYHMTNLLSTPNIFRFSERYCPWLHLGLTWGGPWTPPPLYVRAEKPFSWRCEAETRIIADLQISKVQ